MKMSFEDRRALRRYGSIMKGHYCCGVAGCTACLEQCPKGVMPNEINRCLMYAVGYGDMELARENYERLPAFTRIEACSDCTECLVKCVNGLNLTKSISKAKELFSKENFA